ncbi:unnamed protein product, partial [Heligmosomoides polygyrus]
YNWFVDDAFVTSDDSYRIPAFAYRAGDTAEVRVDVNYRDSVTNEHLRATVSETLTYVAQDLDVVVDAISRAVASDAPAVIDASRSKNPNEKESTVAHEWSCLNITSKKSFNFSDAIRDQNLSGTAWSVVKVGPPRLPQVTFSPFTQSKVGTRDYIRIQAFVEVHRGWLNTTWEVVRSPDTSYFELSTFLKDPNTTFPSDLLTGSSSVAVSLTIPPPDAELYPMWTGVMPGMVYTIRLNAYSTDGNSFADVQIEVNSPPTTGLVIPLKGAVALNTQVEFQAGDGWSDEDVPLEYRFGIRVLNFDNSSECYWFARTGATSHRIYLPAALQDVPACGKRVGFRALLEVCDLYDTCSSAESETFEVSQPPNLTIAIVDIVAAINSDIGNGNVFGALSSMHALDVQRCEEDLDVVTADKITTKLLMTLDDDSDSNDYKEVLYSASQIMNDVSPPVLEAVIFVLEHYRSFLGLTAASSSSSRPKRATTTKLTLSNEQEADDMLNMYDLLLEKNQRIVDVYLLNIQDFLSTFCIQLDASSSRIMSAQGSGYTTIQAQSLVPGASNFSGSWYTIAGQLGHTISFSRDFSARFSSWSCGTTPVICQNICLATSQIKMSAVYKNDQLMEHLFGNNFDSVTANKSVSQLHHIQLLDPLSGSPASLPNTILYSVFIPISDYQPSNYYACLLFIGKTWEDKCITSSYARRIDGVDYMLCSCSGTGLLSVFTTLPPIPADYPDHNEIRMSFDLNTAAAASSTQRATFLARLAAVSTVDERRFVNCSSTVLSRNASQIWVTLRPPFRLSQMTNSYVVGKVLAVSDF